MRGTPVYYYPSKRINTTEFFRNYWCSDYEVCLNTAAREDLYLDCAQCQYRNDTQEDVAIFIRREN